MRFETIAFMAAETTVMHLQIIRRDGRGVSSSISSRQCYTNPRKIEDSEMAKKQVMFTNKELPPLLAILWRA